MSDMPTEFQPRLFTVDEYHRMADVGILREGERVELLDGVIVEMSPIGWSHAHRHSRLLEYLYERLRGDAFIAAAGSFPLDHRNEPEPDIAIVAPRWRHKQPGPPPAEDVYAVIELAQTSISYDLGAKLRLYARSRIPDYLVVDLNENVLLHHRDPHDLGYEAVRSLTYGDTFTLLRLPDVALNADPFLASR
jgi:Uma2 family endonuclease